MCPYIKPFANLQTQIKPTSVHTLWELIKYNIFNKIIYKSSWLSIAVFVFMRVVGERGSRAIAWAHPCADFNPPASIYPAIRWWQTDRCPRRIGSFQGHASRHLMEVKRQAGTQAPHDDNVHQAAFGFDNAQCRTRRRGLD